MSASPGPAQLTCVVEPLERRGPPRRARQQRVEEPARGRVVRRGLARRDRRDGVEGVDEHDGRRRRRATRTRSGAGRRGRRCPSWSPNGARTAAATSPRRRRSSGRWQRPGLTMTRTAPGRPSTCGVVVAERQVTGQLAVEVADRPVLEPDPPRARKQGAVALTQHHHVVDLGGRRLGWVSAHRADQRVAGRGRHLGPGTERVLVRGDDAPPVGCGAPAAAAAALLVRPDLRGLLVAHDSPPRGRAARREAPPGRRRPRRVASPSTT